jgi:uncharacterized protein
MREPYSALFPLLCDSVRDLMAEHPECHGVDHTMRVWHNARAILEKEQADRAVVEYAAWLHDVGRVTEFADEGRTCHAKVGAEMVPKILSSIGVDDEEFIDHVAECVRTHRYRAREGQVPQSIEGKIVYDADKLDSLGAIGVGRAFHFAGRVGARVHNSSEEALAGDSYSIEDSAYREYLVKLRHIHDKLLTAEGRNLGETRHQFMVQFFCEISAETGVA